MTFAWDIEEIDVNYNYNMDPTFDSFSLSSSDRCTGPIAFYPWVPPASISIPACIPRIPVPHRPTPHRSVTNFFHNNALITAARRAQAPTEDNSNIAPASPQSAYPSPPNTNSELSRFHPLPPTLDIGRSTSSSLFFTVATTATEGPFGILDSPLVMRREDLRSFPEKPLSPPLTLPVTTLTLPDAESEISSEGCGDDSEQLLVQEEGTNVESQVGLRKDTLSAENEETLSDLLRSEGMDLSKLLPSWNSEMTIVPENSALLGSSSLAARRSRGSLTSDRDRERGQQPYDKRNRSGPYLNGCITSPSPPWSPQSSVDVALSIDLNDTEGASAADSAIDPSLRQEDAAVSYISSPLSTPLGSDALTGRPDSLRTGFSFDGSERSDLWSPGSSSSSSSSQSHDFDFDRPFVLPLDIPESSYNTQPRINASGSYPDMFVPKLFDDDYSMDVDYREKSSSPTLLSRQRPIFSSPYELDTSSPAPSFLSTPYAEPLPPPSSPSISRFNSLPDLDLDINDRESHPSSPSRRSFATLPDLEMGDPPDITDMDIDAGFAALSLPSPSQSLLSLPGADTDEDLLPPPASNFRTPAPPPHPSSTNLLFIDDPRDFPLPRSPSPEDIEFDLNIVLDDETDPELIKLYNLRKKALAAERAARHAEAQLTDAGSIYLRAEATREKQMNKQRSKEVGALLRLKLGDRIVYSPPSMAATSSSDGYPKGMISSMPQLVARMMFRRREKFKSLSNRKLASTKHIVRSSLSRSLVPDLGDANVN